MGAAFLLRCVRLGRRMARHEVPAVRQVTAIDIWTAILAASALLALAMWPQ